MMTAVNCVLLLFVVTPAVHTVMASALTTDQLHTNLCVGTITQTDMYFTQGRQLVVPLAGTRQPTCALHRILFQCDTRGEQQCIQDFSADT